MGAVYAAENTVIGKQVALKLLRADLVEHESVLQRFLQEARTAAAIDHPGIVEIFDFGWTSDREPYLVMELLKGTSLSEVLKANPGGLHLGYVVGVASQMLSILSAVHDRGIIHRDLKPDNVFLSRREGHEWVRILDFGISKMKTDDDTMRLTHTGTVLGTPFYMAPEQATGAKDLDHRVDIWAAGTILYEMVTGVVPFQGDSYNAVLAKIFGRQFTPPAMIRPEVPEPLQAVIYRAMAWDREARYPTAAAFQADLEAVRSALPAPEGVFVLPPSQGQLAAMSPTPTPPSRPAPATPSSSRRLQPTMRVPSQEQGSAPRPGLAPQTEPAPGVPEPGTSGRMANVRPETPPDSLTPVSSQPGGGGSRLLKLLAIAGILGALLIGGGVIAALAVISNGGDRAGSPPSPPSQQAGAVVPEPAKVPEPSEVPGQARAPEPTKVAPPEPPLPLAEPAKVAPPEPPAPVAEPAKAAPPEPQIREALTGEEVASVLDPLGPRVKRCLERVASPPPEVRVRLEVAGDGGATYRGSDPSVPPVAEGCLREVVAAASFPETGRPPVAISHVFEGPPARVVRRSREDDHRSGGSTTPSSREVQPEREAQRDRTEERDGRFKTNPFD